MRNRRTRATTKPCERNAEVRNELALDPAEKRKREHGRRDEHARSVFSIRSRYHRRMYRAEKVPVAIWTTSTLTVMTKPVSPTERADDRREHRARSRRRVLPDLRQRDAAVDPDVGEGESRTEEAAQQRTDPEAPARVLAQREGAAPRHEPRHIQAHRRTRTAGSAPTLSRDKLRRTSSFVTSSTALMGMVTWRRPHR